MVRVAVIGGDAFGTAMACAVRRVGNDTLPWARQPEVVDSVNRHAVNSAFLPGMPLLPGIRATSDPATALEGADIVILVVPA